MLNEFVNEKFMRAALRCAQRAFNEGEVPIGAVVVLDGKVIARGYNQRTKRQLATAHAEVMAINKACKKLGSWRIPDCDIYVTLEPCPMCLGAMLNSRIKRLYFGAYEGKGTALTKEICDANIVNHKIEVRGGILEGECSKIISDFFRNVRFDLKNANQRCNDKNDQSNYDEFNLELTSDHHKKSLDDESGPLIDKS